MLWFKRKIFLLLQNLYVLYNIFLKQMTLKYLYQAVSILLLWVLIFSSCLNSSQSDIELSHDPQIYSFSMTSTKDQNRVLSGTKFTIDQINNKIFNQDSLPYLFHVDSIKLNIAGKSGYAIPKIVINLQDNDSAYIWNGKDSVAFKRLKAIETTAEDGKKVKLYEFKANIHQQDPYILNWSLISQNHLTTPVEKQKTVLHAGKFVTYYKSGAMIKASTSLSSDGKNWVPVTVSGLPATVKINTIFSVINGSASIVYAQDADNSIYKSADGLVWSKITSDYPVSTIYGKLPSASGEFAILTAVNDAGTLKFALTKDFATFTLKCILPNEFPITDFSAVSLENPTVFSAKYIILSGGKDKSNIVNNKLWIVQEKEDEITHLYKDSSIALQLSQLFLYDNKVYLMTYETGKNILYYSENYGLDWISGGTNQTLPDNFTGRIHASIITDSNNFIWIFGGESGIQVQIVDIWRGRLNKLAN
ncbi:MAG: hypothetical protein BWZ00_01408 [Bacteroidetes bacterium ADurb.BinA174]|nr:MAG: hypothetical protein BWZ00_01408 [Bacteroidetes bacterium ADurb.BinA174]